MHLRIQALHAGDTTIQLLWRLQNGELPTTTDTKHALVHIGSNDLTSYHLHQVLPSNEMLKHCYIMLVGAHDSNELPPYDSVQELHVCKGAC